MNFLIEKCRFKNIFIILVTISAFLGVLRFRLNEYKYIINSGSADIADHYSATNRYFMGHDFISSGTPELSHFIVGNLAKLFQIDPMQAIAQSLPVCSFLFLVSMFLFVSQSRHPMKGLLIFFCGFWVARSIDPYGGLTLESMVEANFFFAQFTGTCVGLLLYSIIWRFLYHKEVYLSLATLPVVWIVEFFHLNPAVVIACANFIFVLICAWRTFCDFYWAKKSIKQPTWMRFKNSVLSLLISGVVCYSILYHPSYQAMKAIAANNGALALAFPSIEAALLYFVPISFAMLVIILVLEVVQSFKVRSLDSQNRMLESKERSDTIIFSIFLSAATLMLVQWLLLKYFSLGSEYAVKKYLYLNHVFLRYSVVALVVRIIYDLLPQGWFLTIQSHRLVKIVLFVNLLIAFRFFPLCKGKVMPIKEHAQSLKVIGTQRSQSALVDCRFPGTYGYVVNFGDFNLDRQTAWNLGFIENGCQGFAKALLTQTFLGVKTIYLINYPLSIEALQQQVKNMTFVALDKQL